MSKGSNRNLSEVNETSSDIPREFKTKETLNLEQKRLILTLIKFIIELRPLIFSKLYRYDNLQKRYFRNYEIQDSFEAFSNIDSLIQSIYGKYNALTCRNKEQQESSKILYPKLPVNFENFLEKVLKLTMVELPEQHPLKKYSDNLTQLTLEATKFLLELKLVKNENPNITQSTLTLDYRIKKLQDTNVFDLDPFVLESLLEFIDDETFIKQVSTKLQNFRLSTGMIRNMANLDNFLSRNQSIIEEARKEIEKYASKFNSEGQIKEENTDDLYHLIYGVLNQLKIYLDDNFMYTNPESRIVTAKKILIKSILSLVKRIKTSESKFINCFPNESKYTLVEILLYDLSSTRDVAKSILFLLLRSVILYKNLNLTEIEKEQEINLIIKFLLKLKNRLGGQNYLNYNIINRLNSQNIEPVIQSLVGGFNTAKG